MEQGKWEPEKEPGNLVLLLIRFTVRNFFPLMSNRALQNEIRAVSLEESPVL